MQRGYDGVIEAHYARVAAADGLASTSTMADQVTRDIETAAILDFVAARLRRADASKRSRIVDVGCGNGYTLDRIRSAFPGQDFVGVERNPELRMLAQARFSGSHDVKILAADIRDAGFGGLSGIDVLICQRVLINIMDPDDQAVAFGNLIGAVRAGSGSCAGGLLFIEAFDEPLRTLNEARDEFGLAPIGPAEHNLYLTNGFFDHPDLDEWRPVDEVPPRNFLSTHYFVSRVWHAAQTNGHAFKRNSHFVGFFSRALPPFIGDYSPLRLETFERIRSARS